MEALSGVTEDLTRDAESIAKRLAALPFEAQVAALNAVRAILHDASPFRDEPVDLVLWLATDKVRANNYNPNAVAPPEMKLLARSIEADGYTQPVVTWPAPDAHVRGHLPVVAIRAERAGLSDRMASTVRHNRARGEHSVEAMSTLVRDCYLAGWPDEKIQAELGMDLDEVVRLKQLTGLAALFRDREFSEAWEARDGEPSAE